MSTFVLVHGGWHGGWVWDKVAGLLRQHGHTAQAPDLPGHGEDSTAISEVTLKAYVDRVAEVIDDSPEPVILVGHSMGGVVISQAAEERPERISALVYVCAFLLQDGQCLVQWAHADHEALVPRNFVFSDDKTSVTLKAEGIPEALYSECSREDIDRAMPLLVPQATAPLAAVVRLTAGRYGRIPKTYVECLRDRAISIRVQREMRTGSGCSQVFTLDCDHSPMLSRTQELAQSLQAVARGA